MDELIVRAIIASFIVALNASLAGSFTVFRRASFLVASSSHSALAGVSLALLLNSIGFEVHYFIFAMIAAILFSILAANAARSGDINTGIAVSFSLSMAIAAILLSMTRNAASSAWQFLFGDILLLTVGDFALITISTAFILLATSIFYHKFLLISFDPAASEALGLNVHLYDSLLIAIISASVVVALKAVGAVLVFSIFIAPSSAAKVLGRSVKSVILISFAITVFCLYAGILSSFYLKIPSGAVAAAIASAIYFVLAGKKFKA